MNRLHSSKEILLVKDFVRIQDIEKGISKFQHVIFN